MSNIINLTITTPAAAHLSLGVPIEEFGPEITFDELVKAPYSEAFVEGNKMHAEVIHINKYGSLHLNILHDSWKKFAVQK